MSELTAYFLYTFTFAVIGCAIIEKYTEKIENKILKNISRAGYCFVILAVWVVILVTFYK